MNYRIILVKLLPKIYESDFLDGNLYLNTCAFFGTVDNNDSTRFDPHDGADFCQQVTEVAIQDEHGNWLPIPIIGPVTARNSGSEKLNILCMYTITDRPDDTFDPKNLSFGDVAIVIDNLPEFLRRIDKAALAEGKQVARSPVQYFDERTYDGVMGPFRKYQRHAYQNEFRFVFTNGPGTVTHLKIGDIRDITHSIRSQEMPSFWAERLAEIDTGLTTPKE